MVVAEDRLRQLKVGIFRRAQQEDFDALMRMTAHFMTNGTGEYMPFDDALDILDELEIGELEETFGQMVTVAQDAAAPKKTG